MSSTVSTTSAADKADTPLELSRSSSTTHDSRTSTAVRKVVGNKGALAEMVGVGARRAFVRGHALAAELVAEIESIHERDGVELGQDHVERNVSVPKLSANDSGVEEERVGIPRPLWERLGTYDENRSDERNNHAENHESRSPPSFCEHPVPISKEALDKSRDDAGLFEEKEKAL
ncbi:9071_t:CDS:2 [Acaulospora colombiana]|uniref:9071_t:CDS:1 n=1 Tax=Acaulospora colombiana TaxID=27376 RepID=A0ACA9PA58_9GLOM|nr:9071_t:CDS:2 [Acaulospora colombiana]